MQGLRSASHAGGSIRLLLVIAVCAMLLLSGPARASDEAAFSLSPSSRPEEGFGAGYTLLAQGGDNVSGKGEECGRDWAGIGRDTAFFLGYQAMIGSILYVLPEDVTGWKESDRRELLGIWWDNVRDPHWDSDSWWVNYLGHPYWGAAYYVRARERGFGEVGSFAYSVLLSTLFEFGMESFFEAPSYQDLIVTPVAGALLGAFVFEPIRNAIKAKPELRWHDYALLVATDPLGGLNSVFEWLFGIKSEIRLQFRTLAVAVPGNPRDGTSSKGHERSQRVRGVGVELSLRY